MLVKYSSGNNLFYLKFVSEISRNQDILTNIEY